MRHYFRLRSQRAEVGRDRYDVIVGQFLYRPSHQWGPVTAVPPILEFINLANDVDRMQSGDSRHLAQSPQVCSMADVTRNCFARAPRLYQRLACLETARRHISNKSGIR